ncbi:hypothetical protein [Pasteuria penetrans]|uniref:hypothetical protein n=1 Tax=Pasteuria penetrans TaxID=86005 RepID=UPI000F99409D|nr:hypothetical protein [Pasteuria penetrans]
MYVYLQQAWDRFRSHKPTAVCADDRLSLVLGCQRLETRGQRLRDFRGRLRQLCDDFDYDIGGQIEVVPRSGARNKVTVLTVHIPVRSCQHDIAEHVRLQDPSSSVLDAGIQAIPLVPLGDESGEDDKGIEGGISASSPDPLSKSEGVPKGLVDEGVVVKDIIHTRSVSDMIRGQGD